MWKLVSAYNGRRGAVLLFAALLFAWTRHFLSNEPYVDTAVVVGCHLGDGEPQQLTPIDGYYTEPLVLDGRILCSVGASRIMSSLAVYDWATQKLTHLPAAAIADLQARGSLAVWETAQKYAAGDVRVIDVATGATWQLTCQCRLDGGRGPIAGPRPAPSAGRAVCHVPKCSF